MGLAERITRGFILESTLWLYLQFHENCLLNLHIAIGLTEHGNVSD